MNETYEEQFGPVGRRLRRMLRACRWRVKGTLGRPRNLLAEIRWRLGDEIMALPIYEALREAHPGAHIAVLCNYPELLDGNPFVDAVNPKSYSPDRYVLLRGAARNLYRASQYAHSAGVPVPKARPRLYYSDWETPVLAEVVRPEAPASVVAVASGASWATKRWPIDCWRSVCQGLAQGGHRIVELGVEEDEEIGVGVGLRGRTSVREAACVLKHADLLICCDSGLMHLALAVGTPTLALFGPTDPDILVRDEPRLTAITNKRACQGCWNDPLGPRKEGECPLHIEGCLDTIAPGEVLKQAEGILGGTAE